MQPRGPGTPLAPVRARGEGAPVSHCQARAFADSWRDTPTSDLGLRAYPIGHGSVGTLAQVHLPEGRRIAQKTSFTPAQGTNEPERVRPGLEPGGRARHQAVPH